MSTFRIYPNSFPGLQPYSLDEVIAQWTRRFSKSWEDVSQEEKIAFVQALTLGRVRHCLMDKVCRNNLLLNSPIQN